MPDEIKRLKHINTAPMADLGNADINAESLEKAPEAKPLPPLPGSFWQRPLGRTLGGKNKPGKIIYGLLGAGVSMLTGINISPVTKMLTTPITQTTLPMDISWIGLLITIVSFALGYVLKHQIVKGTIKNVITDLNGIIADIQQAREPDSEEGKKISAHEQQVILKQAETKGLALAKELFRKFLSSVFHND